MLSKKTIFLLLIMCSCKSLYNRPDKIITLITLDPGHFHAALVQKTMYDVIDSNVFVYAGLEAEIQDHLARIDSYNNRSDNPTGWNEIVYTGSDYLQKMLTEKKGNVVILAGKNEKKTEYIKASVEAGFNVLADKPMAINTADFGLLEESFKIAEKNKVLLYDIMTERSEITTLLQRELSGIKDVFGEIVSGSPENPAITKESVHHFYKYVSGEALKRPSWFFDTHQQGEGIVDVTTHLVDLIQWECFPEKAIDYKKDIHITSAKRWETSVTASQFREVTGLSSFPDFLKKQVTDTVLNVFSNGEINYQLRGIHCRVSVLWNFRAPEGTGDTHYSVMRGTKARLVIRQGGEQGYKPALYIEPVENRISSEYAAAVDAAMLKVQTKYPGVTARLQDNYWEVIIPDEYKISHEGHFAQVMERFLLYLKDGKLPDWEIPGMLAKYYTTTQALEMASDNK